MMPNVRHCMTDCMVTRSRLVTFRMQPEDYARLQRAAAKARRPVSNLLQVLALEYIEKCERSEGEALREDKRE